MVDNLGDFLRSLAASGKDIVLNTNGELLDKTLAYELQIGKNVQTVGIALDGADSETHAKMRGLNSDFEKSLTAIQLIGSIDRVRLKISTTLSAVNFSGILSMGDLLSWIRPNLWRIYHYTPRARGALGRQEHQLSDRDFSRAIHELKVRYSKLKISPCTRKETAGCFLIDYLGNIIQPKESSYRTLGSCLMAEIDEIWYNLWQDKQNVVLNKKWIQDTEIQA